MAEVKAYECEECSDLGRAGPQGEPPTGWLYVTTQTMGEDAADVEPAKIFCTPKCRGLHYRPIQRRKTGEGEADEEGHPAS